MPASTRPPRAGHTVPALPTSPMHSATSSATFSASRAAAGRMSIAAPICATTSRSRWKRRRTAPRPRSASRPWMNAETCHGSGAKTRHPAQDLSDLRRPGPGAHAAGILSPSSRPAPKCHGTGKVISDPCSSCHGRGPRQAAQDPVGQDSRGRGRGRPHPPERAKASRASTAGRRGTCMCNCTSSRTPCSSAITMTCTAKCRSASPCAALGGEIEIPTLSGSARIKIPAETQSGKIFRLRGKGIKGVRSHRPRRPAVPCGGRDPGASDRTAKGTAARTGSDQRERRRPAQPASQILDGQGEGILR